MKTTTVIEKMIKFLASVDKTLAKKNSSSCYMILYHMASIVDALDNSEEDADRKKLDEDIALKLQDWLNYQANEKKLCECALEDSTKDYINTLKRKIHGGIDRMLNPDAEPQKASGTDLNSHLHFLVGQIEAIRSTKKAKKLT